MTQFQLTAEDNMFRKSTVENLASWDPRSFYEADPICSHQDYYKRWNIWLLAGILCSTCYAVFYFLCYAMQSCVMLCYA